MGLPTFDAFGSGASVAGESSRTWNHTCSGSDRYLLVFVWLRSAYSNLAITYNGVAMTFLGSTGGTGFTLSVFGLANPDAGTYAVSVTWTGTSQCIGTSVSYTGVYQADPVGTLVTSVGTTGDVSDNVDLASNELAVDAVTNFRSNSATVPSTSVGPGQTQRGTVTLSFAGSGFSARQNVSDEAGPGTVTMSWTLTNNTNCYHVIVPLRSRPTQGFFAFF